MVGSRKSETTVVNFAGGCARMGSAVAPPHCTTLPHTLPGHSALKPKLHPLFGSRRVEQKVALKGTCFGHCFGDQLTSLEVSIVSWKVYVDTGFVQCTVFRIKQSPNFDHFMSNSHRM